MGSTAAELGFCRQKSTPNLFKITIVTLKAQKDALHIFLHRRRRVTGSICFQSTTIAHTHTKTADAMLLNIAITGNTAGVKQGGNVRHGDTVPGRARTETRGRPKGGEFRWPEAAASSRRAAWASRGSAPLVPPGRRWPPERRSGQKWPCCRTTTRVAVQATGAA